MSLYTTDSARPLGGGLQSPAGSLTESELASMVRNYKRSVASRYRALIQEELEGLPNMPLLVSPKIDGEMWFMIFDGSDAFLASPTGRVVSGDIPVLREAKAAAGRAHGRSVIAGELFAVRKGGRPRVGDLAAAMGGEGKAEVDRIAFAAFDSITGGFRESPERMPEYRDRLDSLTRLFDGGKRLKAIKTEAVTGGAAAAELFDQWVSGGKGEGLVIRTQDNAIVYKAKPSINIDAAIIGYTESSEGPDKVGSVLLGLMREDGQFQVIGSCGNMPTEQRLAFMEQLKGMHVESTYRHANSKGALYRFVRPEIIIEVKLTDIQSETSAGDPIDRMVLEWADGRWRSVRQLPGASILHPVFVRVRDDKTVNPTDIRVAQVLERCLVDAIDTHAERLVLPVSAIVRREVYAKTTKGTDAVRKLVVWKTNKEAADPSYPAFVVHFTDYSPGRKDPLQREVRVAPTLIEAQKIADGMIASNIKKGWDQRA
ncbi:MAG: hypothetical protein H6710_16425 [Myxococcales bacterium]|nr:hypothetical protein [Myxococcales bacterium]